ncbi:hypothetical protein [Pararhizobium haloflavum]|uniref:hypothetical protein n=1 Tax=Pararhizobium haloflavum TaxID=2037914 RepID=UPI000C18AF2D|nr:hypothetical protein [Pararhizobium haloflavum]
MMSSAFTEEREKIVADALRPVASELRLIDAGDLISMLKFECYGDLTDLVASAAELYFQPGTVKLGIGGDYWLDWGTHPRVVLDLELRPAGVTVYTRLTLEDATAGVEISHIAFDEPADDPVVNTLLLAESLTHARFVGPTDPLTHYAN